MVALSIDSAELAPANIKRVISRALVLLLPIPADFFSSECCIWNYEIQPPVSRYLQSLYLVRILTES